MNAFEWANAKSVEDAVKLLAPTAGTDFDEAFRPMGGGQDLHTTLKAYIERPGRVVNLKTIPGMSDIRVTRDGFRPGLVFGATATLSDIAEHVDVMQFYPGLSEAIHSVATPQIRNLGTIGGNLCQRPRCWYFRLENVKCLKRGGDTCHAKAGENKFNAVFGTDAPCVMVHPSDLAPMLIALDAVVKAQGAKGTRDIAAAQFFRMPTTDDARRETVLAADEIVTQVTIPGSSAGGLRSTYLKFKERESLDFAMASVAAVVTLSKGDVIDRARVVLGGVAPVPWVLPAVDQFLAGKTLDDATIAQAAEMAVADAKPLSQNAYKVPLTRTLVRRALAKLR